MPMTETNEASSSAAMLERLVEGALARYRKTGWHSRRHAERMLAMLRANRDKLPSGCDCRTMELAVAYHDVFAPGDGHEERAAELARLELSGAYSGWQDVVRLVLSTSLDRTRLLDDEAFLHDLDWSQFHSARTLLEYEGLLMEEAQDAGMLYAEAMAAQLQFYRSLREARIFESFLSGYETEAHLLVDSRIHAICTEDLP